MERKISFLDMNRNKVICEIELKQKEKGLVFSMSGDYMNGGGQVFDNVKPANKYQKQLISIWKKHHLNDMHAGTKEQEEAIKELKEYNYDKAVELLKQKDLYEVTLNNGTKYKYGHGWLYNELPKDFEKELNQVIDNILTIEKERAETPLSEEETTQLNELLEDEKVLALKESLELDEQSILTIETRDNKIYSVEGIDYWVLDEEEAEEQCREYLEKYLWIEAIKADKTELSFEEWQEEVINIDGYGSILNGYDGNEDEVMINGTRYYVMRC